ncbi:MAG: WD40/YVTN/BNR-like repeat-containing protein [Chitinophagaceae bacterium]
MKIILSILFFANLTAWKYDSSGMNKSETELDDFFSACSVDRADNSNGLIYFSFDNGASWEEKSTGLPADINLTDLAVSGELLVASTKQHGIFIYDFRKNSWSNTLAKPATSKNIDVVNIYKSKIYIGTQDDGIFITSDNGKSWKKYNNGLQNLTIRRIAVIDNEIFVGTNAGLYSLNEQENKWDFEFGHSMLQVNGITELGGEIYIGTNQGVYKSNKQFRNWKQTMTNISLHNISADNQNVYALAYNELFSSADKGTTWQSVQQGLPKGLYTFQLRQKGDNVFIGQWDGVYKKGGPGKWTHISTGIPGKFAITELVIYKNIIIAGSTVRFLNK